MLWLQQFVSEERFWILFGVVTVAVLAVAICFRRPPLIRDDPVPHDLVPVDWRKVGKVLLCVAIACGLWWLFANMIGSR